MNYINSSQESTMVNKVQILNLINGKLVPSMLKVPVDSIKKSGIKVMKMINGQLVPSNEEIFSKNAVSKKINIVIPTIDLNKNEECDYKYEYEGECYIYRKWNECPHSINRD